jgi:hypothetical protein
LHPDIEREYVYLETIEYHCKYSNPDSLQVRDLKEVTTKGKEEEVLNCDIVA